MKDKNRMSVEPRDNGARGMVVVGRTGAEKSQSAYKHVEVHADACVPRFASCAAFVFFCFPPRFSTAWRR
jgi:hypothetical protein